MRSFHKEQTRLNMFCRCGKPSRNQGRAATDAVEVANAAYEHPDGYMDVHPYETPTNVSSNARPSDGYLEPVGTPGSDGYLEPAGTQAPHGYIEILPGTDLDSGEMSSGPQATSPSPGHPLPRSLRSDGTEYAEINEREMRGNPGASQPSTLSYAEPYQFRRLPRF